MDSFAILAQAAETAGETTQGKVVPVDLIWQQVTSLGLLEALTFISFGVVCLFYGWRVFKILVIISFALIGLFVGVYTNRTLIGGNGVWLGIIAMVLFAVFSVPMMRWGVSILGAAAGGMLTAGAWYAAALPEQYIWAGAIAGVIAGGMISFIIFKIAIMLFTSFGGSALVVVGILAIMYEYMGTAADVENLVFNQKWFLPLVLLGPMALGIFFQNKFIKGSKEWSV
jgi:hypothetical protein